MLKASALYMVIIIALVISIFCSAVIVTGYYYRSAYQINFRYHQLKNNVSSGINILLTDQGNSDSEKTISLFGSENDSVTVQKTHWGVFDVGIARSFINNDTLSRAFMIANDIDPARWAALYLIDEDRSLSVSGQTHIRGNAFLPQAGVKEAYVNNQAYTGDKRIIIGTKKVSQKTLPELSSAGIQNLEKLSKATFQAGSELIKNTVTMVSFLKPLKSCAFKKKSTFLHDITLKGHIILYADTTLIIDSTAHLENIVIFAPAIIVKSGFKGTCQLFATDSIIIGKGCIFEYPSCIAVANFNAANKTLKKLNIDGQTIVNGLIFIYDNYQGKLPPVISLEKQVTVYGQVYVQGLLNLKDKVNIYGSAFTNRFLYQSAYTRYENYLINLNIDVSKLSPYYLTSGLMPAAGSKRKVLQWLK